MNRADLLWAEDDAERPDSWRVGDLDLPLSYRFEPGATDDGVTVHVPVEVLARLGGDEFGWQVPALREELVTALIRSLPKDLRRNFVPAPDAARAVLAGIEPGREPLLEAVQRELHRRTGIVVPLGAFDLDKLPAHLRVTFAVRSSDGDEIARGKDLAALQRQLAGRTRRAVADAVAGELERTGLRGWPDDLEEVPRVVERTVGGHRVRGYPGFVDGGSTVGLHVFPTQSDRDAAMNAGTRRLLRLALSSPVKPVEKALDPRARVLLGTNPDGSLSALIEDCADAAVDMLAPDPVWTRSGFAAVRARVAPALPAATGQILAAVQKALAVLHQVELALPERPSAQQADAIADIRAQLDGLLPGGFVAATGAARLADLVRYLTAILRRLERLPHGVAADRERMRRVQAVQHAHNELLQALSPQRAASAEVREIARMIEELRVSLWAQQLGTPRPVSEQRIRRAIDAVLG